MAREVGGEEEELIRPLRGLDEFKECVALQRLVWGADFSETVPVAILMATQRVGGVVAGAFRDADMVGFVYGVTGWEQGRPVHWSDMLAVRPGLRSSGLGSRLKWYQRDVLLGMDVEVMYWTFDPLQSKNAFLNVAKLGAVADEYFPDMYGETDSPLHRGIGSDRFVARWELATPRVEARARGTSNPLDLEGNPVDLEGDRAYQVEARDGLVWPVVGQGGDPGKRWLAIPIPSDIDALKARSMEAAVAWRTASRTAFQDALADGFCVREFVRGPDVSNYWLHRP